MGVLHYICTMLLAGNRWLALTVLFTLCSALSKEQGITVVAVCVVYDFFCLQKVQCE